MPERREDGGPWCFSITALTPFPFQSVRALIMERLPGRRIDLCHTGLREPEREGVTHRPHLDPHLKSDKTTR
jgi:hypothetical protein